MTQRALLPVLLVALAAGCVSYPRPMTREELSAQRAAPAVLHYLGQPDASPAACEAASEALPEEPDVVGPALLDAFLEGSIAPDLFAPCAAALLRRLPGERGRDLAGRLLQAEGRLAAEPRLEGDPALQARLSAIHRALLERPAGALPLGDRAVEEALAPVRRRQAAAGLGPVALSRTSALLEAAGLEQGRWRGEPVDGALLDLLARRSDAEALHLAALRLPDPALRQAAARRLVRLRIAASPHAEVRRAPEAVEQAVLATGANAVSLAARPVRAARLEPASLPQRGLLVRQDVIAQTAKLLGTAPGRAEPSVFPDLPLRGPLRVEVAGLPGPLTLCAEGALDPTPCVAPGDVQVAAAFARLGPGGALQLSGWVRAPVAMELARAGEAVELPLRVGGLRVAGPVVPVAFERPADLVLEGASSGADGPPLEIRVERLPAGRLHYTVAAPGQLLEAVVEWAEAGKFRVVSRGARGANGHDGHSGHRGSDGSSGSSASCPSSDGRDGGDGGDGGNGGDGSDGRPGGDGGEIRVLVAAPPHLALETVALVRTAVASEGGLGGSGGSGGRGGAGGRGGSGGSGTHCTDSRGHTHSLSSGRSGRDGSDGRTGSDGRHGAAGLPGRVWFEVVPAEGAAGPRS